MHPLLRRQLRQLLFQGLDVPEQEIERFLPKELKPLFEAVSHTYDQQEDEVRLRERNFALHRQQLPLAMIEWDNNECLVEWNPAATELFGLKREEALALDSLDTLVVDEDRPRLHAALLALGQGRRISGLRLHTASGQGRRMGTEWTMTRIIDQQKTVLRYVAIISDISERAAAEQALRASEERYSLAVHAVRDGIWDHDAVTGSTWFSPRCYQILGRSLVEPWESLEAWLEAVHPADRERAAEILERHRVDGAPSFEFDVRMQHESGNPLWVQLRGSSVRDAQGQAIRLAGSMSDVTERKRYEERLVKASMHDSLTGLPNRRHLLAALSERLAASAKSHAEGGGKPLHDAIIFIDLDRFKDVNDRLGHSVGDQLLTAFSQRLASRVREGDIVARLGGDEFAVLMGKVRDTEEAHVIATRLQRELRAPFMLGDHTLKALGSMGVACTDKCPGSGEDLLRASDIAMYSAKSGGPGAIASFHPSMDDAIRARLEMLNDLRLAIERDELRMVFQPIVDVRGQRPMGFEALLRWRRAGKDVSPAHFVPMAEEAGLMDEIGQWVLEESVRNVGRWIRAVGPHLYVSVNMSSRELELPDLFLRIEGALARANVQPSHVAIEVTETSMIHGQQLSPRLARLREQGHRIMMDDFGTGYASLQNLVALEFDTIKIDREFSERSTQGQTAFLEAIVHLARRLNKQVVAEGVEDMDLMRRLAFLGVDCAQGWAISRPLEADDVLTWLGAERAESVELA